MRSVLLRSLGLSAGIVAGWLILGAFFMTQDLVLTMLRSPERVTEIALLGVLSVVLFLCLTPFILFLAQGLVAPGARWPRSVARALAIVLLFSLIRSGAALLFVPALEQRPVVQHDFRRVVAMQFHSNATLIGLVVVARVLYDTVRLVRENERRALTLQTQLARAQLEQLRSQLQPHFLFNTINGIATLVHTSPNDADAMLMELAALLRSTLDLGRHDTIPLRRELELLEHYLRIQSMRFQDRLEIRRAIDANALACEVPPLLLQPLVENSLQHAIAQRPQGGRVEVSATREADRLLLRIGDDGPGFDPATTTFGVGIGNTIARLEQLYRGAARVDFARGAGTFVVTIDLPAKEAA